MNDEKTAKKIEKCRAAFAAATAKVESAEEGMPRIHARQDQIKAEQALLKAQGVKPSRKVSYGTASCGSPDVFDD
jgi:hypothetical protein